MTKRSDKADTLEGSCLCGAVQVALREPKPAIDICHCDMCRRWNGMYFGGVGGASFDIEGGDAVGVFQSSDWAERAFCRDCGSHLYFRFLPADNYSFLAGLFDLPAAFEIEQQIFYDQKPGWYDLAQQTPCKTGAEIIAEAEAAGFTFD
ncbi:MAG: GFA family protein [Pontixanthobacter sp.]